MIQIQGTLTVKAITGRNGVFRIGELETPIGDFKVKDKLLEQFEEGSYSGQFMINRIFPECYIWYGKVVTEVRAKLYDVKIDQDEPNPPQAQAVPTEPDPAEQIDDTSENKLVQNGPAALDTRSTADTAVTNNDAAYHDRDDDLLKLFGEEMVQAIKAEAPIKLDPTIDRVVFRQQQTLLKTQLGYKFKASTQTWHKF